jgi:hypothetical protein
MGIASAVFGRYRGSNRYERRRMMGAGALTDLPGEFHAVWPVVNLFGQYKGGAPAGDDDETVERRLGWLERALRGFLEMLKKKLEEGKGGPRSVAYRTLCLPKRLGSDMAGGVWRDVHEMVERVAKEYAGDPDVAWVKQKTAIRVVFVELPTACVRCDVVLADGGVDADGNEIELERKLRVLPGVKMTEDGPEEYQLYRASPWDAVEKEIAPVRTELADVAHPWLVALEEKWPGATVTKNAIRHVNGIRRGDWEAEAMRKSLAGDPFDTDLQVSWTNGPGLAVSRANPLREHLVMLSVLRSAVVDLSNVEGAGSALEAGGEGRAGRRMIAHICGLIGKEPTGEMVLRGWANFETEQMKDAFDWGESLREGVTLRTRAGLKKAVVIKKGAAYIMAATPRWASMCCACRQRTEDLIGEILDVLYVRELRERRVRMRENMRRLRARPVDRSKRSAPWVIEDALREAVEEMEEAELRGSAAKKRRLTLEMHQELEDAGGQRLVETEFAQMEWNGGGGL